jgi:hypothetical protein
MSSYLILEVLFVQLGQQSIGFKVNGGLSSISNKLYDPYLSSQKIYFMPSGQVGFFIYLAFHSGKNIKYYDLVKKS